MKIAFHINCLEQGGAERVVSNLSNQFAQEGYDVCIATEWYGDNEFELNSRVRRVHVGIADDDAGKGRVYKYFKRISNLRRFVREEKPDILIAFAQKAIYRSLIATIGIKCPVCVCVRTDPAGHYDSLIDTLQIRLLFPRAAGFVFQTVGQRDFFPKYARDNSSIILNPIHQKYIDEPASAQRKKEVVQSGRLVDFKNQPMLIDAFEIVHRKHPDYVLKIFGPDSFDGTKEILEGRIKEYGAHDYVKLMGGSDTLEKDLKDAAVYAFSSDWEGLPNALMEAMALKMPIVATDCPCGGPATIIDNMKNGILVPIKDAEKMAEAICYMLENPDKAEMMAEEAGKIADKANSKAIYEQWKKYIDTLCKGKEK